MTNHPQHRYIGLGGLSVTTQGNSPQDDYQLREPRPQGEEREQQCAPLANAGSPHKEQRPLHNRTKARKWTKQDRTAPSCNR